MTACLLAVAASGCPTASRTTTERDPLRPPPGSSVGVHPEAAPVHEGVGPSGPDGHRRLDGRHGDHVEHVTPHMPDTFDDPAHWAKRFDAPERDAWQRPERVIELLRPGIGTETPVILDVGAGTGFFTTRFARAFPGGKVIAADIETSLLQWISRRASDEGLGNIETHLASEQGLDWRRDDLRLDLAFMCNTYHHISGRREYFARILRHMAPGGRLAIVDFRMDSHRGPPAHHKVAAAVVIQELTEAGWRHVASHEDLPDQYFLVFEAAP
jgi:ubiquinone/menaquinone biosynthesis C-methylase UbiE